MKSLTLPGSKSITNRNFILAALANGKSILRNILRSDDTEYMMQALQQLGIEIEDQGEEVVVYGGVQNIR